MSVEATFPEIIDTERLGLRKYSAQDAAYLFQLVDANRPVLLENFAGLAKEVLNVEAAGLVIARKGEEWDKRSGFCYGMYVRSSNTLIGQLQVKNLAWDIPSAELSYFVDSSCQRQGFASEAITAIVTLLFERLQFNRIFVRIIPKNVHSIELAKKLGFRHEGLHRAAFRCGGGELHDVHHFALIAAEYKRKSVHVKFNHLPVGQYGGK